MTKVHRILKSKQLDWLKTYIDFNTDKRKNPANSFEKDFFKLMHNSVYGKTIENLRKIINVRLIISATDYKKYVSKPSFEAKGVNNKVNSKEVIRNKMKRIQSKLHKIGTYEVSKMSLFCFDDKRYMLDNGVNTLAYFHKNAKSQ